MSAYVPCAHEYRVLYRNRSPTLAGFGPTLLRFKQENTMNRRNFLTRITAASATTLFPAVHAFAATAQKARNIVLLHGLFADGSCWSDVIGKLQADGLRATAVQNPLTSFADAVTETRRVLAEQDGPTVLVGHSFSGVLVSEVGTDPKVTSLVYVAARAPDAGEDFAAIAKHFPPPPATAGIVYDGDVGRLTEEAFLQDFAGDMPRTTARILYAVQQPFHKDLVAARTTKAD